VLYFDASYLVRLHTRDAGWEAVRQLAQTDSLSCSLHGRAECIAAFHRKFREGSISDKELQELIAEFEHDCEAGAFTWHAVSTAVVDRLTRIFKSLPASITVPAADALHLASAAENGFKQIYSNDTKLLAASSQFGINGKSIF
jgi:predicted nucleic acid-binding protein